MYQRVNIYDKINELCLIYQQMIKGELSENGNQFYQDQFFNLIFPNLLALYQQQLNSDKDSKIFPEEKNSSSYVEIPEERSLCLTKPEALPKNNSSGRNINQSSKTNKSQSESITGWELEIPKNRGVSQKKGEPWGSFGISKQNKKCSKEFIPKKKIEELCKKMFKKIVLICHPDRNSKYSEGKLFKEASKYYHQKLLIGLIHCSMILEINIDFIELNSSMVCHLISEMTLLIRFILCQHK